MNTQQSSGPQSVHKVVVSSVWGRLEFFGIVHLKSLNERFTFIEIRCQ